MNKAFVREPEGGDARCPQCGSVGIPVGERTLHSFVRTEDHNDIAETGYYCEIASCPVAYFDDFERAIRVERLVRPVWPKDSAAPICGCFGFMAGDVERDVAERSVARVRAAVERSKSAEARCVELCPTGRSCAAAIQKYYFKLAGGA
ncbi:MAG: hypothetical protein JNL96_21200 [Planctomycetaceae bacterium]|nr:hypothetical protein [Planctomycetaceae bacterium]